MRLSTAREQAGPGCALQQGTGVVGDDIIIGKTIPVGLGNTDDDNMIQRFIKRDASTSIKKSETGVIDQVCGFHFPSNPFCGWH